MDALRLPQRVHTGAGSGRELAPSFAFNLTQHPDYSGGPQGLPGERFVPLVVEHAAVNNLSTSAATAVASGTGIVAMLDHADLPRGNYRNRFLAVTADTPIVPRASFEPTAPGMQTAIVVGLPAAAVTSTRDHQVRIQFGWQRGAAPKSRRADRHRFQH